MSDNKKNEVFENFTEADKLEWVKACEAMENISRGEGLREKMTRKIKENPLVPIGIAATTIALSCGLYSMKTGNKKRSQYMMRARVLAQGFTVVAILGGIFVASKTKPTTDV